MVWLERNGFITIDPPKKKAMRKRQDSEDESDYLPFESTRPESDFKI
jgi:hypothetical protein